MPARDLDELTARLTAVMTGRKVPGLSLAIVGREGPMLVTGLGLSDVAGNEPATAQTLFRLGSTSKIFVALSVLRLVEEGRLSLEARVRELVPEVTFSNRWEATDPVRVVHLLEHTTGWDDIPLKLFAHSDPRPVTLAEGLSLSPESRSSRWPPGTRSAYCNSGPAVAAAIVEKVTGQRYEDWVATTFFEPLGMSTADFFLSSRAAALLTTLYAEGSRPLPYLHIALRPAGALNASATDMAGLLQFLLRRGEGPTGRLLSRASLERMETPTTTWGARAGLKLGFGLGNYTSYVQGVVWHGHGGQVEGGRAELAYLPVQGVGYFLAMNADDGVALGQLNRELRAFLTRDLPREPLPAAQPMDETSRDTVPGWYVDESPRNQLMSPFTTPVGLKKVTVTGGQLDVSGLFDEPRTFVPVGRALYRRDSGPEPVLAVLDEPEGRRLQLGSSTYRRVSALTAWSYLLGTVLLLLALVSPLVFALFWIPRWLLGRMRTTPALHVRLLPLVSVLCVAAAVGLMMVSLQTFFPRFGVCTPWSVAFCALTLAFAASSIASLVVAIRAGIRPSVRQGMNRWVYLHSLVTSAVLVGATVYLAAGGWIGLRTWA